MDIDLPGYAGIYPFKETPLDLYRAPMWHAEYDFNKRSPTQVFKLVLAACLSVISV